MLGVQAEIALVRENLHSLELKKVQNFHFRFSRRAPFGSGSARFATPAPPDERTPLEPQVRVRVKVRVSLTLTLSLTL